MAHMMSQVSWGYHIGRPDNMKPQSGPQKEHCGFKAGCVGLYVKAGDSYANPCTLIH